MKFILWNQEQVTITPMENIEQTTCFHMCILGNHSHPYGALWIEKQKGDLGLQIHKPPLRGDEFVGRVSNPPDLNECDIVRLKA